MSRYRSGRPAVRGGADTRAAGSYAGGQARPEPRLAAGAHGARGWIFLRHEDLTAASRQILITAVDAGSPADGVLRTNDVILGVNGKPFADDARKSFGRAITAAEEKTGVLRLIRWREGQSTNVELKLAVLGKYSDTAPYDCPKSKKIFEQGCRLIAKAGLKEADIPIDLNALALLASGKEEYRPMLADYAKKVAASLHPGTWMLVLRLRQPVPGASMSWPLATSRSCRNSDAPRWKRSRPSA